MIPNRLIGTAEVARSSADLKAASLCEMRELPQKYGTGSTIDPAPRRDADGRQPTSQGEIQPRMFGAALAERFRASEAAGL